MRYVEEPVSFVTLFVLFGTVEQIIGRPFGNDRMSKDQPSNITQNQHFEDETLAEYEDESVNYTFIDDMIINKNPSRAGFVAYTWPNGVVPVRIEYTIVGQARTRIINAINRIQSISCVRFRNAALSDPYNILFRRDNNGGCSAVVGWQNTRNQAINLADVCSEGNAIHEIIHALGFFHEQTRDDRDNYVTINFNNIQSGAERNFQRDSELYPNDPTSYFGVPYNYDSIMHYGQTFFSRNGENTIDVNANPQGDPPIGSPNNLGQRDFISQGDVTMLRSKYNCGR